MRRAQRRLLLRRAVPLLHLRPSCQDLLDEVDGQRPDGRPVRHLWQLPRAPAAAAARVHARRHQVRLLRRRLRRGGGGGPRGGGGRGACLRRHLLVGGRRPRIALPRRQRRRPRPRRRRARAQDCCLRLRAGGGAHAVAGGGASAHRRLHAGAGVRQRTCRCSLRQHQPVGEAAAHLPHQGERGELQCLRVAGRRQCGRVLRAAAHRLPVLRRGGHQAGLRVWPWPLVHHLRTCQPVSGH
mmetsp:Transcript_23387/g.49645  ORF Transcript_23387/g.49645 Transcript_23387/m.49645 type:complete len:240 (+) Transcript_23387:1341-2060(+)